MQANFDHCATLVRDADRDRYLATLFVPAAHRNALFALYAFNTEIARVRELAREPMPGEMRLQWWREVLAGERDGEAAAHPVAAGLREAIDRYGIAPAVLISLIDAHSFDLYDEPMPSRDDLDGYALNTCTTVFTLASDILGSRTVGTDALARHAGIAQAIAAVLTNLALHASRRQLYLPLDVLQRHGAEREDIFGGRATTELRAALAELRLYARRHLDAARAELPGVPEAILPALLSAALVRPVLLRMERHGYDPFTTQPLPAWRRQWLLWRAARHPRRMFG